MKYIRTKDGRILKSFRDEMSTPELEILIAQGILIPNDEIVSQSATIEELCDGFVVISEEYDEPHYVKRLIDTNALDFENNWQPYGNGKVLDQTCQKLIGAIIYGAIWTEKGLIYVAKMNEKGELELL